ncbi:GNAT family N-acetyltransferase [Nonomuraea gerenzanensis]|uniref:N-acetyltransferase domain-containing protein n=1 Tax=Nonomuraea gerenzanensis TaxID=93944 RepID=A0A1M4EET1_9ACTN|nr:GNAT family N-acetyltransferase [Nonomuraea gerenzanensis]UBU08814.1 GNAT family N-acetyltransferase [Nonomuraea gerenzanensis]SBO97178.1 FIG01201438: hypothetical protein [Nonomuraea gerenzanensis]
MANGDATALDDPVGASLRGHHAHLARRLGRAATYQPGVATFCAVSADPDGQEWADLAALLGRGELADLFSCPALPPPDWEPVFALDGRQLVWNGDRPELDAAVVALDAVVVAPGAEAAEPGVKVAEPGVKVAEPGVKVAEQRAAVVELGVESVPEMLDLVARAQPGPFWPRTRELGTYLGVREGGRLVAMAGERLRPAGHTEISAVCTAPEARGRGYAARLVGTLVARILARGERPFLHVAETNTGAIALYERLGFETREPVTFRGFRTP